MKFRVRYRRARVTVEGEPPKECRACGRKKTHGWLISLHHWKYAYTTAVVRKDPQLALEHTIPFCFICHEIADMIKKIIADKETFYKVMAALSYAAIDKRKEELNV